MKSGIKIIISGGGTGGHVFPAIAIANALKNRLPDVEILFVGAKAKMEMEKVPAAGYEIIGLDVIGFNRTQMYKNILLPFKLIASLIKTRKLVKKYNPDMVIGVGGYASAPTLYMAELLGIPCLIQEQNSYPGKANKILSKRAKTICVAYTEMNRFFPKSNVVLTGNPIRQDIISLGDKKNDAIEYFGLDSAKKTLLVLGGSLGARTVNNSILKHYNMALEFGYQILWQTGKYAFTQMQAVAGVRQGLIITEFISRMDLAYAVADIVISRAGALSISELCVVGKPLILIPSPNVAEDHQTKNALTLSALNAAVLLTDDRAEADLGMVLKNLIGDTNRQQLMAANIVKLAKIDSADLIVDEVLKLIESSNNEN